MTPDLTLGIAPALARECAAFCRYLGEGTANPYVTHKYVLGHDALPPAARTPDLLDRALLAFAASGRWACGVADSYASVFRPYGALRAKLVLLLAILESSPRVHARFDDAFESSRAAALLGIAITGIAWASRLGLALLLFTPIRLYARVRPARG